ncbi:beta-propeller domain-containing protein [Chondrinema litorale]|uniref:WD40 domain-containing protein n=1 Tax=Chondrinema litorale TaxID=2994555 RepID=UPI0025434FB4|nr:caspase family protein [Chondrinema litorale]UZR97745.1 caspase family protein [Chondrinema litorale]
MQNSTTIIRIILLFFSILFNLQFAFAQMQLVANLGHADEVRDIAYSKDGLFICSASEDNSLKLWEVETGREIRTFTNSGKIVSHVAISPDNKYIVSSTGSNIVFWETATGKLIKSISAHSQFIGDMNFSHDGRYLATGGGDGKVKILNVATGEFLHEMDSQAKHVRGVSFSPDGKMLASTGEEGKILLWDVASGNLVKEIKAFRKFGSHVTFSPDGKFIATINAEDKSIGIWNLKEEISYYLEGHEYWPSSICFSNDSKFIISTSQDNTIRIWDLATSKAIKIIKKGTEMGDGVLSVAMNPVTKQFATGNEDKTIEIWDFNSGNLIKTLKGLTSIARSGLFSPNENKLSVGYADGSVKFWSTKTKQPLQSFLDHKYQVTCLAYSPDNKYFASGDGEHIESIYSVDEIKVNIRETSTNRIIRTLVEESFSSDDFINRIAFSPDSKYIAIGGLNGGSFKDGYEYIAKIWSIETGELYRTFKVDNDVNAIAYSPDAKYLAIAVNGRSFSTRNMLKVWDIKKQKIIYSLEGNYGGMGSIAYSPDGHYIASSCGRVWDAHTGNEVVTFEAEGSAESIAFSPDSRYIAWGSFSNDQIEIWEVSTGKQIKKFKELNSRIKSVSYSKDGKIITSTSEDGFVRLWNSSTGELLASIVAISGSEDYVIYTPDGRFDGTQKGMNALHYVDGLNTVPLASFFEKYYSPNLLGRIVSGGKFEETLQDVDDFKLPPTVKITSPANQTKSTKPTVTVQVLAKDQGGGVDEIRLYHNGKIVQTTQRGFKPNGQTKDFEISLVNGTNNIKATAFNTDRTESQPDEITIFFQGSEKTTNLHMLVIGVNNYKNPKYNLNYALPDAMAFKESIESNATSIFGSVNVSLLQDANATKTTIQSVFNQIKENAKQEDVFIFYFAGHGVISIDDNPLFYLIPHDVTRLHENNEVLSSKGISAEELEAFSLNLKAQKQLFIFDACQSGAMAEMLAMRGAAEEKAIAQLARSTGTYWLAATGSDQFATEFATLGHGLFTYAVLEGLKGAADGASADKKITVKELSAYLDEKVPELSEKYKGSLQFPTIYGYGNDFPITIIK